MSVDDDNDEHYDDDDENDDNDNDQSDDDDNYYEHYDDDDEKPGLVARAWLPLTGWPGKKRTVHALSSSSSLLSLVIAVSENIETKVLDFPSTCQSLDDHDDKAYCQLPQFSLSLKNCAGR